jgi:peptidoglycan/LPS O-acetylase OafA/YrhL
MLKLLERLRGMAALLIVAFHATELFRAKFNQPFLQSFFDFGDSGVDFFFVLSGFFLASSSHKLLKHQHTAKDFLVKRCVRIYPLYWLVSLCVIPIYFLIPSFGKGYEQDMGVIIKSLLLIPQEHAPILSVAWFLSHLIFFYLAFTAVILLPKVAPKIILVGLSVSAFFMLADMISGFQIKNYIHFLLNFIFSYYNLEFAAGWLLGIFFIRRRLKTAVSLFILLTGCLGFMIAGLLDVYILQTSSETSGFSHYYDFIAYGISSILIVAGAAFLEKTRKVTINKWFVVLGAASFSIYLTHYPFLSIFTKIMQVTGINSTVFYTTGMILSCVVTVLMGCIVHVYVEKRLTAIFRKRLTYKKA